MKFTWLIIGIILMLICISVSAQDTPYENYEKMIILHYSIKNNTVSYLNAKVIYGVPSNLYEYNPDFPSFGAFTGRTLGANDAPLKRFGIDDPRISYYETGAVIAEEANLSVRVPYSSNMTALAIYDRKDDSLLVKTEIKQVVADFCKSHSDDPDCGFQISPVVLIAGTLVAFCIIAGGWYFLKKRKAAGK